MLASLEAIGAGDAAAAIVAHFDRFGCRVTAFDPGRPTIDERPGLVLGVLRDLVAEGTGPDELADALARRRAVAEAEMEAAAEARRLTPRQRQRLRETLADARRVWPVREDNLAYTDAMPAGLVRRAMLEIGRRLVELGVLHRADDACWLELDEVRELLRNGSVDGAEPPAQRVLRRRAERAWVSAHPGPVTLEHPRTIRPTSELSPRRSGQTTGAVRGPSSRSSGTQHDDRPRRSWDAGVTGRATPAVRVVRSDRDFGSIRPGDVLVCPITTPAWSLNFSRIGALVTDAGGALSHAAIVAREHGIPAVVATGCATTDLRDGQLVTVDGAVGTVTITAENPRERPASHQRGVRRHGVGHLVLCTVLHIDGSGRQQSVADARRSGLPAVPEGPLPPEPFRPHLGTESGRLTRLPGHHGESFGPAATRRR